MDERIIMKDRRSKRAKKSDGRKGKYVIVRTRSAGVFAGTLESVEDLKSGVKTTLSSARRLWYWKGASSLSQLAMSGVSYPKECKFPQEVERVELPETIEILDVTTQAQESIKEVPIWKS